MLSQIMGSGDKLPLVLQASYTQKPFSNSEISRLFIQHISSELKLIRSYLKIHCFVFWCLL